MEEEENVQGFILDPEFLKDVAIVRKIRTLRDAQIFTTEKLAKTFFKTGTEQEKFRNYALSIPDFERLNIGLLMTVFFVWHNLGREEIPKNLDKVKLAPNVEVQKEIFGTDGLTVEIKADIVRYMRYILLLKNRSRKQ